MRGLCGGKSVCNNWMSLPAATGVLMAGSISASIVHSDIQNITPLFPSEWMTLESFSNEERDGSKKVTIKMNPRFFKRRRDYSNSL